MDYNVLMAITAKKDRLIKAKEKLLYTLGLTKIFELNNLFASLKRYSTLRLILNIFATSTDKK